MTNAGHCGRCGGIEIGMKPSAIFNGWICPTCHDEIIGANENKEIEQ